MQLIDSHCHLDMLEGELLEFLNRAYAAKISTVLTVSTRLSRFEAEILTLTESEKGKDSPDIYCAVGVHPHYAEEEEVTLAALLAFSEHKRVVAIGESGLDYYYERSAIEAQKKSFLIHIEAARRSGLPLIIHSRDADSDMMAILEQEKKKTPSFQAVLHCFTGSAALAQKAIDLGVFISFSGIITFKNAQYLRDIACIVPHPLLLIETDAPYLAPVPMRGKKNEPSFLIHIAACLAEMLNLSPEEVGALTCRNFFRLFDKVPYSLYQKS